MSFFARRRFFEVCATTLLANRAGICPHARACRGVSGPPLAPPTRPGRPQGGRRGCRGGGKSRTLTLTPRPNTVLRTAQAPPAAAPTRAPVRGRLWSEGCSLQSDGRTIRLCSLWPSDDLPTPLRPPVDTGAGDLFQPSWLRPTRARRLLVQPTSRMNLTVLRP